MVSKEELSMPPHDPSPLGDEMAHTMPERKFPEPKPGGRSVADEAALDISKRPTLPDHPQPIDIEDEEADPVTDSSPGIADGVHSPKKQKG
jgi:hypothetical protein